jgi:glyoxylase-like metal-dependent hydrolase (beta-lactamase superfamily II)
MIVNDDLIAVPLPLNFGGAVRQINVSLIRDADQGATLVDTGMPGQEEAIEAAIKPYGLRLANVRRIVLTHQDIDHVGSLHALKHLTHARVYALAEEVPYIDGTRPLVKMPPPERLEQSPDLKALMDLWKPTHVDEHLKDGDLIPVAGGVRAVATPGHTPGHMSLYLERSKVLIAGDALTSENGHLNGPGAGATPDMEQALRSLVPLQELDIQTIVCYHGGLVTDDPNGQLKRVVEGG